MSQSSFVEEYFGLLPTFSMQDFTELDIVSLLEDSTQAPTASELLGRTSSFPTDFGQGPFAENLTISAVPMGSAPLEATSAIPVHLNDVASPMSFFVGVGAGADDHVSDGNDQQTSERAGNSITPVTLSNGDVIEVTELQFALPLKEFRQMFAHCYLNNEDSLTMKRERRLYQGRTSSQRSRVKRKQEVDVLESRVLRQRVQVDEVIQTVQQKMFQYFGNVGAAQMGAFLTDLSAAIKASANLDQE